MGSKDEKDHIAEAINGVKVDFKDAKIYQIDKDRVGIMFPGAIDILWYERS